MRILYGKEEEKARAFIYEAARIAEKYSTCLRSKCGSVIVANDKIISRGFNSAPGNKKSIERCLREKSSYHEKVTDKTCCMHAEQRAIMDALKNNPDKIEESTLYFIRVSNEGQILFAGRPYCTICSKMALDAGIKDFVLLHERGIVAYDAEEYNKLSFDYR